MNCAKNSAKTNLLYQASPSFATVNQQVCSFQLNFSYVQFIFSLFFSRTFEKKRKRGKIRKEKEESEPCKKFSSNEQIYLFSQLLKEKAHRIRRKSLVQLHSLHLNRSTSFPMIHIQMLASLNLSKRNSCSITIGAFFVSILHDWYILLNLSNPKDRSPNMIRDPCGLAYRTHLHMLSRSQLRRQLPDRSRSQSQRRRQVAGCTQRQSPPGLPRIPLARSDMRRRWSPCSFETLHKNYYHARHAARSSSIRARSRDEQRRRAQSRKSSSPGGRRSTDANLSRRE